MRKSVTSSFLAIATLAFVVGCDSPETVVAPPEEEQRSLLSELAKQELHR